ncbi:MAG: hypothetical protein R2698_14850 [Microthrixaceae bacterium]
MIRSTTRRGALTALAAGAALLAGACVPDSGTPTTTTTTTIAPNPVKSISDATFEWTISREVDNGTYAPGQVNYWSAGQSDSTEDTYVATNGNAMVLKKNASGDYVPIGSEPSVSWATRGKDGAGNTVTATNAFFLGQLIRYSNGVGTVNVDTGEATIHWTGTVTVNVLGLYLPFWIVDPTLTVDAEGTGRLTASVGGYVVDRNDTSIRTPLTPVDDVVLAEIPDVFSTGAVSTGFAAGLPDYLGRTAIAPPTAAQQPAQSPANAAYWGSWPQSFVDFHLGAGAGSYWYTSGGSADPRKVQEPIAVSYTLDD